MDRRNFLKKLSMSVAGVAGLSLLAGCIAPRVSPTVADKSNGQPWRCQHCGHLTRSNEDLSNVRCPRCKKKRFAKISEEELQEWLDKESKQ